MPRRFRYAILDDPADDGIRYDSNGDPYLPDHGDSELGSYTYPQSTAPPEEEDSFDNTVVIPNVFSLDNVVTGWEYNANDWREQERQRRLERERLEEELNQQRVATPRLPRLGSNWYVANGTTGTVPKKKKETPPAPPKWQYPNILETLESYKKYPLKTTAHSMLSPVGVEEVRHFLARQYDINWTYTNVSDYLGLEENAQHHLLRIGREEHKVGGKFISRLGKCLHLLYSTRVTDHDKAELNKLIDGHWVGGESFWIDRPTTVDWEAGEFGEKKSENGSCWWFEGGLSSSRSPISRFNAAMKKGKTGAIRLWLRDGDDFQGVGRVWYIRTYHGFPILFNGYGLTTTQWAAKLSRHFDVERYKSLDLYIAPDMVINNHSGIAFDYVPEHLALGYSFHLLDDRE